jgi:hypothetical protein
MTTQPAELGAKLTDLLESDANAVYEKRRVIQIHASTATNRKNKYNNKYEWSSRRAK